MNNYTPTKKEFYIAIGAMALGLLFFTVLLIVVLNKIALFKKESANILATTLGIEETYLIRKKMADWRREIDTLNSFFVEKEGEVVFIEKLETVAKNTGVKIEINSIQIGKKETGIDFIENLELKVRFEGEWSAVAKFLSALENMPHAISIYGSRIDLIGGLLWKGEADLSVLKFKN